MTSEQVDKNERDAFIKWRKKLAKLEEEEDLILTPFEKNLEIWRQLWRVIERSDIVVQIVDARNPLLFHNSDLSRYVREVDPSKRNLLLVNKADLLPEHNLRSWKKYFDENGIVFIFFSALWSSEMQKKTEPPTTRFTSSRRY